jgi:hypothetical protein
MRKTKPYLLGVVADLRFKLWTSCGGSESDLLINSMRNADTEELLSEIERLEALIAAHNPADPQ